MMVQRPKITWKQTSNVIGCIFLQISGRWTNENPVSLHLWRQNPVQGNFSFRLCFVGKLVGAREFVCGPLYEQDTNTITNSLTGQNNCCTAHDPCPVCTVMLLTNLVQPYWESVACDKSYVGDIICSISKVLTHKDNNFHTNTAHKDKFCLKNSFKKFATCYSFHWIGVRNLLQWRNTTEMFNDSSRFQYLFNSISAMFPPIFSQDLRYTLLYHRYSNIYNYTHRAVCETSEAFVIERKDVPRNVIGGNIFSCGGTYMSYMSLNYCDTKESRASAKYNTSHECPLTHYKSHVGTCHLYFVLDEFKSEQVQNVHHNVHFDNSSVCAFQSCDNCSCHYKNLTNFNQFRNVDESNFNQFRTVDACSKRGKVSCIVGQDHCYNVSDICTYKLSKNGKITPCQAGGHIYNCREFDCNMMFKCPLYYCIPWGYVCDGKWDCPGGHDEHNVYFCGEKKPCTNLFRCWGSHKCIHLGDICDNEVNCPKRDDELMCSLWDLSHQKCPQHCTCLLYNLYCFKVGTFVVSKLKMLPYFTVVYKMTRINLGLFNVQHKQVWILHITHSHVVDCCPLLKEKKNLTYVNVEFNAISEVRKSCIQNLFHLKLLKLNNNKLLMIHSNGFVNLSSLLLLNLSSNMLGSLPNTLLKAFPLLHLLSIKENNLSCLNEQVFEGHTLKIVESNRYQICCFVSLSTNCTTKKPWYISCGNLLPNIATRVLFNLMALKIVVANVVSLICQIISLKRKMEKTKVYGTIVISVNVVDITCGIQLLVLFVADIHYKGSFILQSDLWRSGSWCFSAFALALNLNILSPFLLSLLALARLMIVLHPFDSQFKRTKTVLKYQALFFCVSIVISISITTTMWAIYHELPSHICSPYLDPTNSTWMMKIWTWITMTLLAFATIFIAVCHVCLVKSLQNSQQNIESAISQKKSNSSVAAQLIMLSGSNIMCWIPTGTIFITSMFLPEYPVEMMMWTMAVVVPINSVLNPVVFMVTALRKMVKCTGQPDWCKQRTFLEYSLNLETTHCLKLGKSKKKRNHVSTCVLGLIDCYTSTIRKWVQQKYLKGGHMICTLYIIAHHKPTFQSYALWTKSFLLHNAMPSQNLLTKYEQNWAPCSLKKGCPQNLLQNALCALHPCCNG